LTDGQAEIFLLIFQKRCKRCHIRTFTRYGKSHTVALAVLSRVATFPEKWCIVSGTEKQSRIIMGYIIEHTFDNEYTKGKLEITTGGDALQRLRIERSKSRLTFRHTDNTIGEVFILSGDSRNKQKSGDAVMGFGAPNVVLDEAALVDDEIEAKIFRMLGDKIDNFYFKIGNPFRLNHFYRDANDPNFYHINVDWKRGVAEGRTTQEFIDEAMRKPFFGVLYDNKFPPADMVDDKGYVPLLAEKELRIIEPRDFVGEVRLGVDPAGLGSDETKWVARDAFKARVVGTEKISTPKSVAQTTMTLMHQLKVRPENVFIDNFGEGANVAQELMAINRLNHSDKRVTALNVGDKSTGEKFMNLRAQAYWTMREWILKGGELIEDTNWNELLDIKYRANNTGRLQVMPKSDMFKLGIMSPNTADALMLTFCKPEKKRSRIKLTPKPVVNYITGRSS